MRKNQRFYVALISAFLISSGLLLGSYEVSAEKKATPVVHEVNFHPDRFLIKFRVGASNAQINAVTRSNGITKTQTFKKPRKLKQSPMNRWRRVSVTKGLDIKKIMEQLAKNPVVEIVEHDFKISINLTPNDPLYPNLWGLNNIGQTGGSLNADIDAPEAWSIQTGSNSNVLVAVIDTGVDYTHPDLAANHWTNPGEIPGNGIDDDGNGYIDDVYGYDFSNYDADPFDDHGHGTHVSGTIAGVGDNGVGVTGVSWGAKIMAVKFLSAGGSGYLSDAVNAVLYAADMDAQIMSNSWGGGGFSQALEDAISTAYQTGALFVAAAGNSNSNNDLSAHYPSSYEVPNVVAVAATDHYDARAYFSSYGATTVDLGAPGVSILSTVPITGASCCSDPSGYKLLSGTSMATPHVSGVAALLLAHQPGLTVDGLKGLLFETVDPISSMAGITLTGGRLNVSNAVGCDNTQMFFSVSAPTANFELYQNEDTLIKARVSSCGLAIGDAAVTVGFDNGDVTLVLYDDGLHQDGAAGDGNYANTWTPSTIGSVTLTATATQSVYGTQTVSVTGTLGEHIMYYHESTAYNWIDAMAGTAYSLSDDSGVTIPMGFNFEFYGLPQNTVTISSNGFLTFGSSYYNYSNTSLPTTALPNNIIAPFWDDLNPGVGGTIYSLLEGTAPDRRLTIAWVGVPHYGLGGAITFEATLYEGSNEIIFQYQDMSFEYPGYDYGGSATIGLENPDGTDAMLYSYNQAIIQDQTAIRFYHGPYNHAPVADAGGPYEGIVNQAISFDGTGSSDQEQDPLTYTWNFGDGTTGSGPTPTHVYTSKGTFTASLVVNDGIRDSLAATATVLVPNHAPVVDAGGPYNGNAGVSLQFDASGTSDLDGDSLSYYWNFGDGYTGYGVTPIHSYNVPGEYNVTLTVYDGTTSSQAQTTATIINLAPISDAGPDLHVLKRDKIVYLDGTGSYDPEGFSLSYQWRQVSGPTVDLWTDWTATTNFTFPRNIRIPAEIVFELTVADRLGSSATDQVVITITNN